MLSDKANLAKLMLSSESRVVRVSCVTEGARCSALPFLPPNFNDAQKLPEEELIDILYYGIPNSWKNKMTKQGIDPLDSTLYNFLESSANAWKIYPTSRRSNQSRRLCLRNTSLTLAQKKDNQSETKYCLIHRKGNHSSNDCRNLAILRL